MNVRKLLIGILSAGLMLGTASASFAHPHHSYGHGDWADSSFDHRAYRPYRHHRGHSKPRHHHKHRHYHRPPPRYRSRIWHTPSYDDGHWGFTLFFRD